MYRQADSVSTASSLPVFLLDARMVILSFSDAARQAGVFSGPVLRPLLSAADLQRHKECCHRSSHTDYRAAMNPQNRAVFSLSPPGIGGCSILYVTYRYTLRDFRAEGLLFRDITAYLSFLYQREKEMLHKETVRRLGVFSTIELLRGITAEEIGHPAFRSLQHTNHTEHLQEGKQSVALTSWIRSLLDTLRTDTACIDADILFHASAPESYAALAPDSLSLVLTLLLGILDDISESRSISLQLTVYGHDHEIRLSTACRFFSSLLQDAIDIRALSAVAPRKHFALALAEYLIAQNGFRLRILEDPPGGTLTLALFLPALREDPEFKTPTAVCAAVRPSPALARAILALLPDPEE